MVVSEPTIRNMQDRWDVVFRYILLCILRLYYNFRTCRIVECGPAGEYINNQQAKVTNEEQQELSDHNKRSQYSRNFTARSSLSKPLKTKLKKKTEEK